MARAKNILNKMTDWPKPYGDCEHLRQTGDTETSNPITAAFDIVRGFQLIFRCYKELDANGSTTEQSLLLSSPSKFLSDIYYFSAIDFTEVWVVFLLTVLWTLGRQVFVSRIYTPVAHFLGVLPGNVEKFSESAWKSTACSIMWFSAVYVTFFCEYDFFSNSLQQYTIWKLHEAPLDLCAVYAIEVSFYFHSVYATLVMDAWRRDSMAMLCHHLVALTLIIFSYSISTLTIGVLIFVLDDINDVLLELGKCATYLRNRKSGYSIFWDMTSNVMAVLFASSWVVFRLYMHLTKVWRAGSIGIWTSHPVLPLPFHLFQNCFLGSLYVFYVYWSWFIVLFIVRLLFSRESSAVEDPRESDEMSESESNPVIKANGDFKKVGCNGHAHFEEELDDEAKMYVAHSNKKKN